MGRTSVSRRLVFIKKTKNPVAPLPRKSPASGTSSEQMVGEKAKPAAVFAAPASRSSGQASGALKFVKFAAIFAGIACAGAAIAVMGNGRATASRDYAEPEARSVVSRPAVSRTAVSEPGGQENGLPAVLAQRSTPTDESFRASGYARRR